MKLSQIALSLALSAALISPTIAQNAAVVNGKSIPKAKLDKLMEKDYGEWEDENARIGFSRNQTLIDLRHIPNDIKEKIINTYEETIPVKGKILDYFIANKLKSLIEVIEEF